MSHLEQEIYEQPARIAALLQAQRDAVQEIAAAIRSFNPGFVWLAARGTSDNAARYAQYLFGIRAGLAAGLATPSVHTLYGAQPALGRALVIGVSQSGQSADVRRVLSDARAQGALTLSLTNDPASPLAQETEYHLPLSAGVEKSVAATKTYTTELTLLAMLGDALAPEQDPSLQELPHYVQRSLDDNSGIKDWIADYADIQRIAVLGRGYNYSTAYEIALKIKELCYIPGEEYSEADFRHGPIAIIQQGFPVIMVMPQGAVALLQRELLEMLRRRNARCLVISNQPAPAAAQVMPLPTMPEWLSPIAAVIPGQLFALRLAEQKGHDVDEPRGLTKVTDTQ